MSKVNRMLHARTGNAMVLAALILLALTSVGLVSVQQTNTGLMSAGNIVRANAAGQAADAAINHTMFVMGTDGEYWMRFLALLKDEETRNPGSGTPFTDATGEVHLANTAMSMSLMKRSSGEVGNNVMAVVNGATPESRMQQDIAYDGEIYWIEEVKGMAGWQTDADWCFQMIDVRSRGGIPNGLEATHTTLCPLDVGKPCFDDSDCTAPSSTCQNDRCSCVSSGVVVEARGRVLVGPTTCQQK